MGFKLGVKVRKTCREDVFFQSTPNNRHSLAALVNRLHRAKPASVFFCAPSRPGAPNTPVRRVISVVSVSFTRIRSSARFGPSCRPDRTAPKCPNGTGLVRAPSHRETPAAISCPVSLLSQRRRRGARPEHTLDRCARARLAIAVRVRPDSTDTHRAHDQTVDHDRHGARLGKTADP